MILRVALKVFTNTSFFTIAVSLDLPQVPTDAREDNSSWKLTNWSNVSIDRGFCVATKVKHAFPDQLMLANRGMDQRDLSSKVVAGQFVVPINLHDFLGSDLGIRETGDAFVSPTLGVSSGRSIEWSIEPGQSYPRSLDDFPRGDFPTPPERVRNTV
jgi:hypothetical protein